MTETGQQMDLFGRSLDVTVSVKRALAAAMRAAPWSREQIVDRINNLLGEEGMSLRVTINTLEKWAAPSARHQIPLAALPFFCRAVGSVEPLRVLAGALGLVLAGQREQALIRLGEAQLRTREASRLRRRALEALEEMSG